MAELTPTPDATTSSCCSADAQATCCEPSEKDGCCTTGVEQLRLRRRTDNRSAEGVREVVRERYAAAARAAAGTGETAC